MTTPTDKPDLVLRAPEEGDLVPVRFAVEDMQAEVAVRVGGEWVGLGRALADMEARIMAAIAYAGGVPEVHPDA